MKNKKLLLWLVSMVALVALMVGIWFVTREKPVDGSKQITVTVVHKDGSEKQFTIETDAEYLDEALLGEDLITGEMSEYGLIIRAVDGEEADWDTDQGWWQIFEGEEAATLGASSIVLRDGDSFRLVYTVG